MTTTPIKPINDQKLLIEPMTPEQKERVIAMLDEWMNDESGYDEAAWPELKAALNRERDAVGARRLFDD